MIKEKTRILIKNKQNTNLFIYGLGQAFNLITPLLVVPYIVTICGIENYGKISIAMAISFFIMVFIDYGSDIIGVKEVAVNRESHNNLEQLFITTYSAKFILLLIVLGIVSILFFLVPYFSSEKALFFLGLPILIGQFLNPTWFLQGVENFKWITILTILSKMIYLFGIFFFIHQKSDYVYINLWWGIGTILANGLAFLYIVNKNSYTFSKTKNESVVQLIKTNFTMFSSQIFVSLQMYAPIMLIGFLGNNMMAGQYKIVDQVIVVFKTYINLFFNFVYPRVCYLVSNSVKEGLQFWKNYNGVNFVFVTISMGVIYTFSTIVVCYFTKTDVVQIGQLLKTAVFIPFLLSISISLKQTLLAFNFQQFYIKVTMLLVVLNLIAIVLLIPSFKIYGVLTAIISTEILTIIIYYLVLKDKLKAN